MTSNVVFQGIEDIRKLSRSLQADIILYNGDIDAEGADKIINMTSCPMEEVGRSLHKKIRYPANAGEKIVEQISLKELRDDEITTQQRAASGTAEKKRRTAETH